MSSRRQHTSSGRRMRKSSSPAGSKTNQREEQGDPSRAAGSHSFLIRTKEENNQSWNAAQEHRYNVLLRREMDRDLHRPRVVLLTDFEKGGNPNEKKKVIRPAAVSREYRKVADVCILQHQCRNTACGISTCGLQVHMQPGVRVAALRSARRRGLPRRG